MLYNININQEAAVRSGLPIKIHHLAVIAVMKNMFSSPDILETWHDGKSYKWVAIQTIANELPLFDLQKRRISEIISELEGMGVIMRHPENQRLRKSFFRAGPKWSDLFTSMQKSADLNQASMQKSAELAMQKSADNHNTSNHNTITNNKKSESNPESELPSFVLENRKAITTKATLPFDSSKFAEAWETWLKVLSEKGKAIGITQQELAGKNLRAITLDEEKATKIVLQAAQGGYPSFVPLIEKQQRQKQSATNNGRSNRENRTPFVDNDDRWTEIQTPEGIMRIRS